MSDFSAAGRAHARRRRHRRATGSIHNAASHGNMPPAAMVSATTFFQAGRSHLGTGSSRRGDDSSSDRAAPMPVDHFAPATLVPS